MAPQTESTSMSYNNINTPKVKLPVASEEHATTLEERDIFAALHHKEDGSEVTVIARKPNRLIDDTGNQYVNMDMNASEGDITTKFNKQIIQELIEKGMIPLKEGAILIEMFDSNDHVVELNESLSSNKDLPNRTELQAQFQKSLQLSAEKTLMRISAMRHLITINQLLAEEANSPYLPFVKSIGLDEFPLVRLLADQINRLPDIIEGFSEPIRTANGSYIISSRIANSRDDKIELEYRYPATSMEQAQKIRQNFTNGILREQLRDALTCWAMAAQLKRWEYTCSLTKLMSIAHPAHKTKFSAKDKARFYGNLESSASAKFTVTKKDKKGKEVKIHIPLITIRGTKKDPTPSHKKKQHAQGESIEKDNKKANYYPTEIEIGTLPNNLPRYEPLCKTFAGIKTASLALQDDDMLLAAYFDIRKSQLKDPKTKYIIVSRDELIKKGHLSGTKHTGSANRRLLEKLERLKKAGVIINYPKRITETMTIQIR